MIDTRYSENHVWARIDVDGSALIGISDYAQEQLGDIVYVELPDVGSEIATGEEVCVIESVKSTSEIYAPISGTVIAVNETLSDTPEIINDSPIDDGWIMRVDITDQGELQELMDDDDYEEFTDSL